MKASDLMNAMVDINVGAVTVPGIKFSRRRESRRYEIVAQNTRGAVALWTEAGRYGGIALHSPTKRAMWSPSDDCHVVNGRCWSDANFSAYEDVFLPLLRGGDSAGVLRELAAWHKAYFGK